MLWIHPDRAAPLGIADGDEVDVNGGGRYSGRMKANVTHWIHPDAVFMLHGYGATVPLATRALGLGVATSVCSTTSSTTSTRPAVATP